MEVKLGQLAQTNASSQAVKDFGQSMVTDHENGSMPTSESMMQKMTYERLSHKTGTDFDKATLKIW